MPAESEPLTVPAAAWSLRHLFVRGHVIQKKYRVEGVLGVGGIGVVLSVTHLQLDELVALKILLPGAAADPDLVARFEREARAVSKIRSEHVVRVYDVGSLDDGTPYFVMEQLDGKDLSKLIARDGPFPIETTVDYVLQACEALAEAHGLGMVHRDLKPSNLVLCHRRDGTPCIKLIDFGMTKVATTANAALTHSRSIMGSPAYISPEQLRSTRDVDARTDIWSLGVVLFELLTGALPFKAETIPSLILVIIQDPPKSLGELRPEVPEALTQVVLQCLAKKPDDRYANVAELASALSGFGSLDAATSSARVIAVLRSVEAAVSSGDLGSLAHLDTDDDSAPSSDQESDHTPSSTIRSFSLPTPRDELTPSASRERHGGAAGRRRMLALSGLGAAVVFGGLSLWMLRRPEAAPTLVQQTGAPAPTEELDAAPVATFEPAAPEPAAPASAASASAAAPRPAIAPRQSSPPSAAKSARPAGSASTSAAVDEFAGFGARK